MLRRTWFALTVAAGFFSRARAQSRQELARQAAEGLANTPYKSEHIMMLPQAKLIEILEDDDASEFAKAKACQRLAVIGDSSAAPALAALLDDPKLGHYARFGLEPIPGAAAERALRDALPKLSGNLLIGVINSIGHRRDIAALDALATLRHHDDAEVQEAALAALTRIRSPR